MTGEIITAELGVPIPILTNDGPINFGFGPRFEVLDWSGAGRLDIITGGANVAAQIRCFRNLDSRDPRRPVFREEPIIPVSDYVGASGRKAPSTSYVTKPIVVDWDGDGVLDMLVAGRNTFIFYWHNRGTNEKPEFEDRGPIRDRDGIIFSFECTVPELAEGNPYYRRLSPRFLNYLSPVVCDWFGDGGRDLLVGNSGGCIWLLEDLSQGNGAPRYAGEHYDKAADDLTPERWRRPAYTEDYGARFSRPTRLLTDAQGDEIWVGDVYGAGGTRLKGAMSKPVVTDWDGDGRPDLLVGSGDAAGSPLLVSKKGRIEYFKNVGVDRKGGPLLVHEGCIEADNKPLEISWHDHFAVVDWDRDGRDDLLLGCGTQILFYRNTAPTGRPPRLALAGPLSARNTQVGAGTVAAVVDWRGVGSRDIVEGGLRFLGNNGVGLRLGSAGNGVRLSKDAIVFVDEANNPLRVEGHSEGTVDAQGKFVPGGGGYPKPALCDWNRDGRPDLIVGSDAGYVYYFEGLPQTEGEDLPRRFRNHGPLRDSRGNLIKIHNRSCPAVGDWDDDGDLELLVTGSTYQMGHFLDKTPGGELWYFDCAGYDARGHPVLAPGCVVAVDGRPVVFGPGIDTSLATGDIDGDGRPEIIVRAAGIRVLLAEAAPAGVCWRWGAELPGNAVGGLGDIDGDGRPELVYGGGEGGRAVYRKIRLVRDGRNDD